MAQKTHSPDRNSHSPEAVTAETGHHMPKRRERLKAFMRLKSQNRVLMGASGALGAIALSLGAVLAVSDNSPETVRLGNGLASVDAEPVTQYEPLPVKQVSSPQPAPSASDIGAGQASYYGPGFEGRRTASGERFDPNDLTAAHRTLPMGSRVRVTNSQTGDSVVVRINDRGPFHGNRVIDLSQGAARSIGLIRLGTANVRLALMMR
ncbi:MAG: septal ring lytic transglycosylase RlpA family protein [Erythrobacter sp.]|uniref:septal ring lytic transglycosylase RlpA family protein n=1 Tax=Erythrobacter sp. TaxID=1042 RepID=UPI003C738978